MSDDLGLRKAQSESMTRANRWHKDKPWSLSDWMTALAGEVGEVANIIKKLNRHRDGVENVWDPPVRELEEDLGTELADSLAYLLLLSSAAGVDLAEAFVKKYNDVSFAQGWHDLVLDELEPWRSGGL
jgi:NTP pyrophosphatase (non-canonical NTP hydrolase)